MTACAPPAKQAPSAAAGAADTRGTRAARAGPGAGHPFPRGEPASPRGGPDRRARVAHAAPGRLRLRRRKRTEGGGASVIVVPVPAWADRCVGPANMMISLALSRARSFGCDSSPPGPGSAYCTGNLVSTSIRRDPGPTRYFVPFIYYWQQKHICRWIHGNKINER